MGQTSINLIPEKSTYELMIDDINNNNLNLQHMYAICNEFLNIKHREILDYYFAKHKLLFSNTPSNL